MKKNNQKPRAYLLTALTVGALLSVPISVFCQTTPASTKLARQGMRVTDAHTSIVAKRPTLMAGDVANGRGTPGPQQSNDVSMNNPNSLPLPAPKTPQILLIGDSISIGYTPLVKERLKDVAVVTRNAGNAEHTGTGLREIERWLGTNKWEVIHFNWGLWDLCYRDPNAKAQGNRDKVKGRITTSLEQYEKNLERLVQRLEQTGAILIWANTTAVPEGEAGRVAGDELKYNAVAARVMTRHGITINDLHALTKGFAPELFIGPGDVHFKAAGSKLLADQVAEHIRAALPSPRK